MNTNVKQNVSKCIDKAVLSEFESFCHYSQGNRIVIPNSLCFSNGKQVAKKLTEKLNSEIPDIKATYKKEALGYWVADFFLGRFIGTGVDYKKYMVDVTLKDQDW